MLSSKTNLSTPPTFLQAQEAIGVSAQELANTLNEDASDAAPGGQLQALSVNEASPSDQALLSIALAKRWQKSAGHWNELLNPQPLKLAVETFKNHLDQSHPIEEPADRLGPGHATLHVEWKYQFDDTSNKPIYSVPVPNLLKKDDGTQKPLNIKMRNCWVANTEFTGPHRRFNFDPNPGTDWENEPTSLICEHVGGTKDSDTVVWQKQCSQEGEMTWFRARFDAQWRVVEEWTATQSPYCFVVDKLREPEGWPEDADDSRLPNHIPYHFRERHANRAMPMKNGDICRAKNLSWDSKPIPNSRVFDPHVTVFKEGGGTRELPLKSTPLSTDDSMKTSEYMKHFAIRRGLFLKAHPEIGQKFKTLGAAKSQSGESVPTVNSKQIAEDGRRFYELLAKGKAIDPEEFNRPLEFAVRETAGKNLRQYIPIHYQDENWQEKLEDELSSEKMGILLSATYRKLFEADPLTSVAKRMEFLAILQRNRADINYQGLFGNPPTQCKLLRLDTDKPDVALIDQFTQHHLNSRLKLLSQEVKTQIEALWPPRSFLVAYKRLMKQIQTADANKEPLDGLLETFYNLPKVWKADMTPRLVNIKRNEHETALINLKYLQEEMTLLNQICKGDGFAQEVEVDAILETLNTAIAEEPKTSETTLSYELDAKDIPRFIKTYEQSSERSFEEPSSAQVPHTPLPVLRLEPLSVAEPAAPVNLTTAPGGLPMASHPIYLDSDPNDFGHLLRAPQAPLQGPISFVNGVGIDSKLLNLLFSYDRPPERVRQAPKEPPRQLPSAPIEKPVEHVTPLSEDTTLFLAELTEVLAHPSQPWPAPLTASKTTADPGATPLQSSIPVVAPVEIPKPKPEPELFLHVTELDIPVRPMLEMVPSSHPIPAPATPVVRVATPAPKSRQDEMRALVLEREIHWGTQEISLENDEQFRKILDTQWDEQSVRGLADQLLMEYLLFLVHYRGKLFYAAQDQAISEEQKARYNALLDQATRAGSTTLLRMEAVQRPAIKELYNEFCNGRFWQVVVPGKRTH